MPSSSGPNTVNDSIVFNYDIGDVANSYKGEPTTNLASGLGLIGMSGISLSYIGLEDGWLKYSMSGTFTGGGYPYTMYLNPVSFTGGVQYSTQAIVKTNVPHKFNYFGSSGVSYVNEPMVNGGTSVQTTLPDGSSYVARVGFAYTNSTSQPGYLFTNPINNTTFNASTDFVYLKNFQVEQKDHCTQYTPSSRSTTQGLLDISGKSNTITLANMSYDANAQPSFDGTDDYLGIGSINLYSMVNSTLEAVIYMNNLSSPDSSYSIFGGISDEGYHGYHEIRNSGSGYKMTYWTSANGWRYANTALSAGQWYHVVWVWNGTNLTWYLNGVNDGSYAFSTFSPYGLGINRISSFPNERYMNGQIPIAKIYNKALSSTEVSQNYRQYKTRFNLS
jgi:hypothetical protein